MGSLATAIDAQVTQVPPHARAAREAGPALTFAVIGDYGVDTPDEAAVASLVHGLGPEFVVTVGDNNYPLGEAATIDLNIGQYYQDFIFPYLGTYGSGSDVNRFFPCLGNHDWATPGAAPYLAYFTLPGNERYYDFRRGPVHFFALDSDPNEPDGITSTSVQAAWLQVALAASTASFKIVYLHHPPYSSSEHGSTPATQWPFRAWGADLVLQGHDHCYERVVRDGFPYVTVGNSGRTLYTFGAAVSGSQVRFALDFGALRIDASDELCTLRSLTIGGLSVDTFALRPQGFDYSTSELFPFGSAWRFKDDGSNQGVAWQAPGFDDSSWSSGPGQLGYGDGDEATVVSYGPDPSLKPWTTYFRHAFTIVNAASIVDLRAEFVRDDGIAVYLNGVEVVRDNLPTGMIAFDTPATTSITGTAESSTLGFDLPASLLVNGTNVVAVEIHQNSQTSSDISFDVRLTTRTWARRYVDAGAVWKYRDAGLNPGAGWRAASYDDSAWPSGPAQLGYGDGDESTLLSYGPDPNNKPITTWFRKSFTVSTAPDPNGLLLRVLRDDAALVYLNGVEILRENLPWFGLTSSSRAGFTIPSGQESAFLETHVDPRLLVIGPNVLAVEIHQSNPTSSDLSFDLELLGN